jgi:hypothetical protein
MRRGGFKEKNSGSNRGRTNLQLVKHCVLVSGGDVCGRDGLQGVCQCAIVTGISAVPASEDPRDG